MFHYSWQNIDNSDLNDFARHNGYIFKQLDVAKQKLPYKDNSVDIIISHFIERLTSQEVFNFLKECYRILKPNSIIRLTIIDTELIVFTDANGIMNYSQELSNRHHVYIFDYHDPNLGLALGQIQMQFFNRCDVDVTLHNNFDFNAAEVSAFFVWG